MLLGFYYKSALLFFFFVQGIIFSGLLIYKGLQLSRISSIWLGFLVFLSCLYVAPWMLGHAGWYASDGYREFLFFVPMQQFFFIGPVILFYIRSLLDPSFKHSKQDLLHFVPAIMYLLYSLVIFIVDFYILEEFYFYADGRDKDLDPWYQIAGTSFIIIYTAFSYKYYNAYRKRIFQELSFADSVIYHWIRQFLVALLVILSIRVFFLVIYPNWGDFGVKWWYYFCFACTFYYVAFAGYMNAVKATLTLEMGRFANIVKSNPPPNTESDSSPISKIQLEEWKSKIIFQIQQEEHYKNPTLTLADLAAILETTPRHISLVINQGFQMNFNDFINSYRVEALKEKIQDGHHRKFTLLSLAVECGFNSKATFNRAFKKNADLTPNQFIKMSEI